MNKNIFGQFTYLTQKADKLYRNDCPIFSFMANLAYNAWIVWTYEDEEDWDAIVKRLWLHTDESGGWTHTFEALYKDYIGKYELTWKIKSPKVKLLKFDKNDKIFDELISAWYAIRVWISVNKSFLTDSQDDWKINRYINYKNYKWVPWDTFWHFFNITSWVFNNWMKWKDHVIDNYHWSKKHNLYEINLKEMKKIMYKTCYAIVPIL
jgi:hypothetical protein